MMFVDKTWQSHGNPCFNSLPLFVAQQAWASFKILYHYQYQVQDFLHKG
jgi:hypothetical protein